MDTITEKIAHFVGAFEIIEEQARLRAEYDKFRAIKAAEEDQDALDLSGVKAKSTYKLEDYDPKLKVIPPAPEALAPLPADLPNAFTNGVTLHAAALYNDGVIGAISGAGDLGSDPGTTTINYEIPPPSGMVNLTLQMNTLSDNDMFGEISAASFQPIGVVASVFQAIVDKITTLGPIQIDFASASDNWMQTINDIQQAAASLADSEIGNFQTTVFLGEGAQGTFSNGSQIEEFTSFDDLLPTYFAKKIDDAEAENEIHDFDKDFNSSDSPFKVEDGVQVVAGANSLVNTATINSTWLDADVIAASGDVIAFDAISQTNVLIDQDQVSDLLQPEQLAEQASTVVNAASISTARAAEDVGPGAHAGDPAFPDDWVVVHHDGPLVQLNWVQQYNFVTDFDSASLTSFGAASMFGLGENLMTNTFDAFEVGYQYDLILVGGDLIDINMINQLNILLDSDVVDTTGAFAQSVGGRSTETGEATAGHSAATDGVAGIEDAAADDEPEDETEDAPEADTEASDPISTGDNLLYNQASIETIGQDTQTQITEAFAETLENFANGDETIADGVVQNELFDGTELLRVLYVDGDFTTVNVVDQTNIAGDADQVHLARDTFADALQTEIEVTTGSNILANTASIRDNGIDSTTMAQGEMYSDALLHQAELVDNEIAPTGQSISDLATEAVAFLTDDLDASQMVDSITADTNAMVADTFGQSDIMQTMLA